VLLDLTVSVHFTCPTQTILPLFEASVLAAFSLVRAFSSLLGQSLSKNFRHSSLQSKKKEKLKRWTWPPPRNYLGLRRVRSPLLTPQMGLFSCFQPSKSGAKYVQDQETTGPSTEWTKVRGTLAMG